MASPVISIEHVSKYFAKVIANKDVSLTVDKGEVVALLGENGAGKSTIMKILYGLYGMDEGRIMINGEEAVIKSPKDAMRRGIAMIQQHFSLVATHTVTENIILGNASGVVDIKKYDEKIRSLAQSYGFQIPVEKKVGELAVGVQQKVEILKALYLKAKVLIMDEPTAVLTPQEAETLMQFIKSFTAEGNSIIFITHKLKEVMEVADRIVVMRNGAVVSITRREDTNEHELAKLMIGQDLAIAQRSEASDLEAADVILALNNLTLCPKNAPAVLDDVSFYVHKKEVFGIAGVSGNGQDELCEIIAGAKSLTGGELVFCGEDISKKSIRERIEAGIGYVPVDRYRDGMVMEMTLAENMLLKSSFDPRWEKHGLIDAKTLENYTKNMIEQHRVKATGPNDTAKSLSGGNQQKVVLAREVGLGKKLLILNQPTRGLDMGAVERIHKVILEEKENGKAILLISTELSEIFDMCDRIAVMYKGRIMGIYRNGELSTSQIGLLMAGIDKGKEAS